MAIFSVNRFHLVYCRLYVSEMQHRNYKIQEVIHNPLLHILISTFELQASLVIFEENFLEFFSICCTINLIFKVDLMKLKCLNGQLLRVHPHVTVSLVTE